LPYGVFEFAAAFRGLTSASTPMIEESLPSRPIQFRRS
jgi:hypothetical protein